MFRKCRECNAIRGHEHQEGWTYATDDVTDGNADYALCPAHKKDCAHPDDDRVPLSGYGWICTLCQTYVDTPAS